MKDLNHYEIEAQDILWAMEQHGDTVKKAVSMALEQGLNNDLDDFELERYCKRIAANLDD